MNIIGENINPEFKDEEEEFRILAHDLLDLRKKKSKDYGDSWSLFGLMGVIYQICGKSIRLWNLRNKDPQNESVRDTLRDISIYSMMAMILIDRNQTEPRL